MSLRKVPGHREVNRLKQACHIVPSNWDKKSHEGEALVQLCNYTECPLNSGERASICAF